MKSHTYFVLDVICGDILSQGVFDTEAWQFYARVLVNNWGIDFLGGYEDTR